MSPAHSDDGAPVPSTRQLRVFLAVAGTKSFSAAAAELLISQSAVSRSVAELENALGTALFTRSSAGAELTSSGRRILASAQHVVEVASELRAAARDAEVTGEVTIAAFRSAAGLLLPTVVQRLRQTHPGVTLRINAVREVQGGVGAAVEAGAADLGVTSLPTSAGLLTFELARDRYVRVEPVLTASPRELPFICWEERCSDQAVEWLRRTGSLPGSHLKVEDDQVVLAHVAAGLGWSMMPAFAAQPLPAGVRVRALADAPIRSIGVCVRPEALRRRAVSAVYEAARPRSGERHEAGVPQPSLR